jgi:hypothetical protein
MEKTTGKKSPGGQNIYLGEPQFKTVNLYDARLKKV